MTKTILKANKQLREFSSNDLSLVNYETLWLENKTRPNTKTSYRVAFREYCALLRISDSSQFRAAGMGEIIRYRQHLTDNLNLKPHSIRSKLAALSDCYEFLKVNGVIDINPVESVERPKVDESRGVTPVMTDAQVLSILEKPDTSTLQGARDLAILCFYLYMGSRLSSASSMAIGDYYEDNGFYVLNFEKKDGKRQIEAVNPQLQAALNHYLDLSSHSSNKAAPLFISIRKDKFYGRALSRKQFSRIWAKYRNMAGLDTKFTPHSARATFATMLDRLGEPLQNIQHLLGHANPSTTQTYTHRTVNYQDSAVVSCKLWSTTKERTRLSLNLSLFN